MITQAYVIIDVQNDFVDGSLGTAEAQAIVPKIEAKLQAAKRDEQIQTDFIFTQDTHNEDYLSTQEGRKLPVPHCIRNTHGWRICPALLPYTLTAQVFEKPTFGCTQLAEAAAPYGRLVLMGLCTDICVINNAMLLKAYFPEKEIIVDSTCCAGATPQGHEEALRAMERCQINVI